MSTKTKEKQSKQNLDSGSQEEQEKNGTIFYGFLARLVALRVPVANVIPIQRTSYEEVLFQETVNWSKILLGSLFKKKELKFGNTLMHEHFSNIFPRKVYQQLLLENEECTQVSFMHTIGPYAKDAHYSITPEIMAAAAKGSKSLEDCALLDFGDIAIFQNKEKPDRGVVVACTFESEKLLLQALHLAELKEVYDQDAKSKYSKYATYNETCPSFITSYTGFYIRQSVVLPNIPSAVACFLSGAAFQTDEGNAPVIIDLRDPSKHPIGVSHSDTISEPSKRIMFNLAEQSDAETAYSIARATQYQVIENARYILSSGQRKTKFSPNPLVSEAKPLFFCNERKKTMVNLKFIKCANGSRSAVYFTTIGFQDQTCEIVSVLKHRFESEFLSKEVQSFEQCKNIKLPVPSLYWNDSTYAILEYLGPSCDDVPVKSVVDALKLGLMICECISRFHSQNYGIFDVKLENFCIRNDEAFCIDGEFIVAFGIALPAGAAYGSKGARAPEMMDAAHAKSNYVPTPAADVYAFGVLLAKLFWDCDLLFANDRTTDTMPRNWKAELSFPMWNFAQPKIANLTELICHMLHKTADNRPTINQVHTQLESCLLTCK